MFEITGKTIKVSRADEVSFDFSIQTEDGSNYLFQEGDIVKFQVLREYGYNKDVVMEKIIEVQEETEKINIELSSQDTSIENIRNQAVTYWYEISLNNVNTIIGYDDSPAEFILLPAREDK